MNFTKFFMKLHFTTLCFSILVGLTAFKSSPEIKIQNQKRSIEILLNSNEIDQIKWLDESDIRDRYKNLIAQKFYVRIFNDDLKLTLPNRDEPGCYAYESFQADSLFETQLNLGDFLVNPVDFNFTKNSDKVYCLVSIHFKSKVNNKRKLKRLFKFKRNNPSIELAIILVEIP